ncbi:MAG: alpha/beta hydrolase family protein [Promethearchaeota archaeon]
MRKRRKTVLVAAVIVGCVGVAAFAGWYFLLGPTTTHVVKPFQDPFVFNNGTRVSAKGEWELRRAEIKALLLDVEYGRMPGRPDAIVATRTGTESLENGTLNTLVLTIIPKNSSPSVVVNVSVWEYIPTRPGPFPTIVKVSPDGTGSQVPIHQTILDRGYGFVCYQHTDLDPDTSGYDEVGPAQAAYPEYDWGSLAVWAWGAMRVADYLLGEPWVDAPSGIPDIDPGKLVVTGHSRRGKTALIAGAFDERFSMVDPNGSGCGGAGSFLVQGAGCETLESITSSARFKSWFKADFGKYGHNEGDLPFDQHFIRALVAPRALISTDGLGDKWANPIGTQAVYEASQPVFDFLGVPENNAIHFRDGGHGFKEEDFSVLLDFADKALQGRDVTGDFYMEPFEMDFPIDYTAPE